VVEKEAVHELDSDSDEDDNHGGWGTGATSMVSNLSDSWAGIKPVQMQTTWPYWIIVEIVDWNYLLV
jgi:hypothetical protein